MSNHASALRWSEREPSAMSHSRPERSHATSAFSLADNRPETARLTQLRRLIASSPVVGQLRAFQAMADASVSTRSGTHDTHGASGGTALPDSLKSGAERLSGISLDDVKVHYGSDKPAQLQAHAYAQGNEIHLAPGQEKHLPHEAWHVVQQKQGRVAATRQLKGGVGVNEDHGLEAEADAMGAAAEREGTTSTPGKVKHVATGGVRRLPGVVQRLKVTTPISYTDPISQMTYEFDDILEMDLTAILAAGISVDEPGIETFEWMLKGARAQSVLRGAAQEVADIDEVLHHLANPAQSAFAPATGSHRLGGSATDFGAIQGTVQGLFVSRGDYGLEASQTLGKFNTRAKLNGYTKLREYVAPFTALSDGTLNANTAARDDVLTLFSWLIPLHDGTIKGLPNKESLMYRIKICLTQKTNTLKNAHDGTALMPAGSLIRYGAMQTIAGKQLGARSEIKTALTGALSSGDPATARQLESDLTQHFHFHNNGFVAGHLVADTLGGKNVSENLTPITNQFNTSGGGRGIKDPEIAALARLKNGKVIFYSTTVTYGNSANGTWQNAVRPTRVQVRLADLGLKANGVSTNIADYDQISNEVVYVRDPT